MILSSWNRVLMRLWIQSLNQCNNFSPRDPYSTWVSHIYTANISDGQTWNQSLRFAKVKDRFYQSDDLIARAFIDLIEAASVGNRWLCSGYFTTDIVCVLSQIQNESIHCHPHHEHLHLIMSHIVVVICQNRRQSHNILVSVAQIKSLEIVIFFNKKHPFPRRI